MANTLRWGALLLFFGLLTTFTALAEKAKGYATTVIIMRGKATRSGNTDKIMVPLKVQERIKEGAIIATGPRSFVKLLFTDNSQMNLGPNSKMRIEHYNEKETSVLKLISGQLRAKITKDVLKEEKKRRKRVNKFYIRTKTAAMSVRGTEFLVTTPREGNNPDSLEPDRKSSTLVISFEDTIAITSFNQENRELSNQPVSEIVAVMAEKLASRNVVLVSEGDFSAVRANAEEATPAARISPVQFEALKSNKNMLQTATKQTGSREQQFISPIPPGVDPLEFASEGDAIMRALEAAIGEGAMNAVIEESKAIISQKEGSQTDETVGASEERSGDNVTTAEATVEPQDGAPLPGGYVDLKQGIYIEPRVEEGATFDPEQGVYTPNPAMQVGENGELVLPEGTVISEAGELMTNDGTRYVPPLPRADTEGVLDPTDITPRTDAPPITTGNTLESAEGALEEEEEAEFDEIASEQEDQETVNSSSDSSIIVIIDI